MNSNYDANAYLRSSRYWWRNIRKKKKRSRVLSTIIRCTISVDAGVMDELQWEYATVFTRFTIWVFSIKHCWWIIIIILFSRLKFQLILASVVFYVHLCTDGQFKLTSAKYRNFLPKHLLWWGLGKLLTFILSLLYPVPDSRKWLNLTPYNSPSLCKA